MDFIKMMQRAVNEKQLQGKMKTAALYSTATISFSHFITDILHLRSIDIRNLNRNVIAHYEHYLIDVCGVTRNTSSAYMRPLKTTYNYAVKLNICVNKHPFDNVFTGIDKTCKRAVSQCVIKHLIALDLTGSPELQFSRDLFLFSFYTRGMSFIDVACLTHHNINNGRIVYSRHKTRRLQSVKIEPPIQAIIDRYISNERKYIFPILKDDEFEQKCYDSALRLHNLHLHKLSQMLNLTAPLTSYVARHSWATQAHRKHIPVKVISEALGHTTEETTIIYLASLNESQIDKANHKILLEYQDCADNV